MRHSELSSAIKNSRGVFFDLYGTLFIYGDMTAEWADWVTVFHSFLSRKGFLMPQGVFEKSCGDFFKNNTFEESSGQEDGLTSNEWRLQAFCSSLSLHLEREEIGVLAATLLESAWQKHCPLDPDSHFVLKKLLPHKTLAVISNFDHPPHIHATLHKSGLRTFFRTVVISGDLRIKKPDPRIFHKALQETGLKAEEVVYIGDAEDDVIGARAAGILPILIRRESNSSGTNPRILPTQPKTYSPDDVITIRSLQELTEFLK